MNVERFSSSDGVHLVYEVAGPINGPPVVFCHGLAASGEQFADDAAWFAARGYRVLVPHIRGHGLSDSPAPVSTESLSIARLAADQIEMLDHAGVETVQWVGNSLGGIVALEMVAARRFASLATFGTTYAITLPRIGGHRLIGSGHRILGANVLAAITARVTSRDPGARVLIEKILRELRPDVVTTLAGVLTHYDLIAKGAAADIPILMMRGGQDRAVNAGLRDTMRVMQSRPNFRLVDIAHGGHVANLDARDAVRTALLDFWGSIPR